MTPVARRPLRALTLAALLLGPGLAGTPVTEALGAALPGWKVWVGNDATAACWGEHARGAGQGADEVLMITLGTGIGGGIISGGQLVEGDHRFARRFHTGCLAVPRRAMRHWWV